MWWWRQEFRGEPNPFLPQAPDVEQTHGNNLAEDSGPEQVFSDLFTLDQHYFGMYTGYQGGDPLSYI
jgi:hypothetical protein